MFLKSPRYNFCKLKLTMNLDAKRLNPSNGFGGSGVMFGLFYGSEGTRMIESVQNSACK